MTTATQGLTYYVTRYFMSPFDGGSRRLFLTIMGTWTPNRDNGERFGQRLLAENAAKRFVPTRELSAPIIEGFRLS